MSPEPKRGNSTYLSSIRKVFIRPKFRISVDGSPSVTVTSRERHDRTNPTLPQPIYPSHNIGRQVPESLRLPVDGQLEIFVPVGWDSTVLGEEIHSGKINSCGRPTTDWGPRDRFYTPIKHEWDPRLLFPPVGLDLFPTKVSWYGPSCFGTCLSSRWRKRGDWNTGLTPFHGDTRNSRPPRPSPVVSFETTRTQGNQKNGKKEGETLLFISVDSFDHYTSLDIGCV